MDRIKLTIVVITYNHEKYIKECINSILKQNIPFNYEVLIGEDASIDGTTDVLKNMRDSLPDNFHIIFRNKNIGMNANLLDLLYSAKGEYLIILEGDDYWIDINKVNKQIGYLESNNDYVACSHRTIIVDENSRVKKKRHIAEMRRCGEYTFNDFRMWKLPGQTTTIMMRNVFVGHDEYKDLFVDTYPGDRSIAYILLINGKILFMNDQMSAYRLVTRKGDSFSSTNRIDYEFCRMHAEVLYKFSMFSKAIGLSKPNRDKLEQLYFRQLFRDSLRKKKCLPDKSFLREFCRSDCKIKIVLWIFMIPFLSAKELLDNYYWKNY